MKTVVYAILFLVGFSASGQTTFFAKDPTLTPDGKTIIYSYEGDLWKVASDGGGASRITGMQGEESLPSVSPDGKWVAFTATQYGNSDVFVVPLSGGEIKQLTFHDAADRVESWSWDSQDIFFTSSRENRISGYKVSVSGETPQRLFPHYFNTVHNFASHPRTGDLYFNESLESSFFEKRKGYKGAYNPNIKSYNEQTKKYKEHTSYDGKDFWATIDVTGKIYFVSDEENGVYNLYTFSEGIKTALTTFDTAVIRPRVNAMGTKVVFTKEYQIHLYDVITKKTTIVPIESYENNTLHREGNFNLEKQITFAAVSPDQKKIALVSRGRLFVSDKEGNFVKQLPIPPKERVVEVQWLKDSKTLIYNRTVNGYLNWFTIKANDAAIENQLTTDLSSNVNLTFNKDKTLGAYISGRNELRILDLRTLKSETVVKDEFWAMRSPKPRFSPDGAYIAFSAMRNFENDILVYHMATKQVTNLTETGVTEYAPYWSPDGRHLFFESNLTEPKYPIGLKEQQIYKVALDRYDTPYKSDRFNELFQETQDTITKKNKELKVKKIPKVRVSKKGFMDRLQRISPDFGYQENPIAIDNNGHSYLFYTSNHSEGKMQLWKTSLNEFEENITQRVSPIEIESLQFIETNKKLYVLLNNRFYSLAVQTNKLKEIAFDFEFSQSLQNEFEQMFYETWASLEENFYDNNFHGIDWKKLKSRYETYIPFVKNRSNLRELINDMLGELNTSHIGFKSKGKEEKPLHVTKTSATGIVFAKDDPYMVTQIVAESPADKINMDIRPGDELIAVNHQKVKKNNNRFFYFSKFSPRDEMVLTFSRGGKEKEVKIHPTSTKELKSLLYDEWVDTNQFYVDEKSKNTVAYIHMKKMTETDLNLFKREMVSETLKKKALILDLRYNRGGNVHDDVLQFLSKKNYMKWKYREGVLTAQPNFGLSSKPIIMLINEQSLSDAEITANGFKELKLGKLVGTETYRWIIFTTSKELVDGSSYRLPSWGCYTLGGENLEKTGVAPDIYIKETFEDRLNNKQPQLDRALLEIEKALKE